MSDSADDTKKPSAGAAPVAVSNDISSQERTSDPPDWKLQLLDSSLVSGFLRKFPAVDEAQGLFSSTPWVLHHHANDEQAEDKAADGTSHEATLTTESSPDYQIAYPTVHYLDLRRQQNIQWADQRLAQGIQLAQSQPPPLPHDTYTQARATYEQGLELVPDHVDLLVALGALQGNHGKSARALELFQRALDVDPAHANARAYFDQVQACLEQQYITQQQQQRQSTSGMGPTAKAVRASLDASLERNMMEPNKNASVTNQVASSSYDYQYPLLKADDTDDRRHKKRSKHHKKKSKKDDKKKRKSRHKKHRKHRRRLSEASDSSASSVSSSSSREGEEDRHRSRKGRKRRRNSGRKSRNDNDDLVSLPSVDDEDEAKDVGQIRERTAVDESILLTSIVDRVPIPDGDKIPEARRRPNSDSPSSPRSEPTNDSLNLSHTQNLRRLVNRHDYQPRKSSLPSCGLDSADGGERESGSSTYRDRSIFHKRSRSNSDDGSGTINSLDLVAKSRKRCRRLSRSGEV